MLSDTGLPAAAAGTANDGAARVKRPRLKLGVFSHRGVWKVYEEFAAPQLFPTRRQAVAAAQARALAESRKGRAVELFVEEEDGALRQIAVR
jgi:hypothetical protein